MNNFLIKLKLTVLTNYLFIMVSIQDLKVIDQEFLYKIKEIKKPDIIDKSIEDYIFYESFSLNKSQVMLSTFIFISKLQNKINKRNINIKKRKRYTDDDIKKIKCYQCKKDITRLYEKGMLHTHCCFT